MPREPSALGLLIRQRREKMRLSRAALARKAHLSESTVKNAESGRHGPTRATLADLAVALEMPELVGPQAPQAAVAGLLDSTGPQALAVLLKNYSVQTLAEALRLARADLWALFAGLFPVTANLAANLAQTRLDLGALVAEQQPSRGER